MVQKRNIIQEKSFDFALEIIGLYKQLNGQREYVISKQLLRSGTSIGANIEEALGASSKKDFINKMYLSLKEARETRYWLRLLEKSNLVDLTKIDIFHYLPKVIDIVNILVRIIKSSKDSKK